MREVDIGYKSQKCTQAVQVGFHKSTPVKHKHMLIPPPQPAAPYLKLKICWEASWVVHENGQHLTTQSERYHSLSGTISFLLLAWPATWRVRSKVFVWNVFGELSPALSFFLQLAHVWEIMMKTTVRYYSTILNNCFFKSCTTYILVYLCIIRYFPLARAPRWGNAAQVDPP